MDRLLKELDWLDGESEAMAAQLIEWAAINSGSDNMEGLTEMLGALRKAFAPLGADEEILTFPWIESIDNDGDTTTLPCGAAYNLTKHESAPIQLLLVGHMDTVFSKTSSFQKLEQINGRLHGPGVADAKGGLMVMLKALETLERSPMAGKVGWEVFINGNEEIGSQGSGKWLADHAKGKSFALVFEPSPVDGAFISSRWGSINLALIAQGRAAHVGRDFASGQNAITALSCLTLALDELNDEETIVNIGTFHGGDAANVVPEKAFAKINIRSASQEAMKETEKVINTLIREMEKTASIKFNQLLLSKRPPKPFNEKSEELYLTIAKTAKELGQSMEWKSSGGVCDGNLLAAAGLPTIDTMGPIGDKIHTHEEWVDINSLVERAKLAALIMMKATH